MAQSQQPLKIFVLVHGLQGKLFHLEIVEKKLKEFYQPNIVCFNLEANANGYFKNWSSTSDGIDTGGERLKTELISKLKSLASSEKYKTLISSNDSAASSATPFATISFIGSSLGGLYCRYIMGELYNEEFKCLRVLVSEDKKQFLDLKLENYIALASPLISVRCLVSSFVHYGVQLLFFMGTGSQMVLGDGKEGEKDPICVTLADPSKKYWKALASCSKRITLCSFKMDEDKVPYQSSAIMSIKHFQHVKSSKSKLIPNLKSKHVLEVFQDDIGAYSSADKPEPKNNDELAKKVHHTYCYKDSMEKLIFTMIDNLRQMTWIRANVDAYHREAACISPDREDVADMILTLLSKM